MGENRSKPKGSLCSPFLENVADFAVQVEHLKMVVGVARETPGKGEQKGKRKRNCARGQSGQRKAEKGRGHLERKG